MANTLFNKVLGENEKCVFYFYLKTKGTFWPNIQRNQINLFKRNDKHKKWPKDMKGI